LTALSPRHRQIVELVGRDGLTYKQVAVRLKISSHTVVEHVRVIVDRAQMGGRPRAILNRIYYTEVASPTTAIAGSGD